MTAVIHTNPLVAEVSVAVRTAERELPRLAVSKAEAAGMLGVSVDFFEQHLMPELRIVRLGRRRLIPVRELERWLDREAARALEGDR